MVKRVELRMIKCSLSGGTAGMVDGGLTRENWMVNWLIKVVSLEMER